MMCAGRICYIKDYLYRNLFLVILINLVLTTPIWEQTVNCNQISKSFAEKFLLVDGPRNTF